MTTNVKSSQNSKVVQQGQPPLFLMLGMLLLLFFGLLFFVNSSDAAVANFARVNVGSGGVQANDNSYYLSVSEDATVVAFESFASNWGPDQTDLNFVDIFVHNRSSNITRKISVGGGGENADQRSFDPFVSADGRYISFISYATNLVDGDTNRHDFVDDGLDVFLYDWNTGVLQRVSLNWKGEQINDNSVGRISPDGRYVIFASSGDGIINGESNSDGYAAIYKRDLVTGAIERITQTSTGGFPNGSTARAVASLDGRFIAYVSNATNIVPDGNAYSDVMLYDSKTDETILISKPATGGSANDNSSAPEISEDGRYIVFRSFATNLVPNDTNGKSDIFVYDRLTGETQLVSVSSSGVQANEDSRDPAICGNGRFVSFTTEATNLVSLAYNGHRQVYVHDLVTQTTFLATGTDTFMGNGRAHRSTLAADCRTVGFATEATNLIAGDTNEKRDLFVADIIIPPDLSPSTMTAAGYMEAGEEVTYTFTLANLGTETAVVNFSSPIPANTTYVNGSATGATYNSSEDVVEWSGDVPGEGEVIISYTVTVNPALTDFTLITNQTSLTWGMLNYPLEFVFAVNGLKTYLPIVHW